MKNLLKLSILLLLFFMPFQQVVGQIIMGSGGSLMIVNNIEDGYNPSYFYDPGGIPGTPGVNNDPDGYFAQGLRDTITLRTCIVGTQLYVLFEEFAMGDGDTLWIFDGQNVNSQLIGEYSLVNSPGELWASGREMTFVFHSDSIDILGLQDGWKAQVYAYDPVPFAINYGDWTAVATCNAFFYDSGGPNGNINANGTPANNFTEFISPLGTHIKCEFTEFSVNGVLKIFDGQYNNPNKRLIGQFCTSTLDASTNNRPPVLFSTSYALSFVYEGATGDENKSGWRAEISCVSELVETPNGNLYPDITNVPMGDYANVPDPHVIELDTLHPMVVLRADIPAIGRYSNDYKVEQIPYDENEMLFGYNEGTSINNSQGDVWLSGVPLPFVFMFFGKAYNTVYPGTNGLISMSPQSGSCFYSYSAPSASPPYSSIPYNYKNCIYGVYEDVDSRYYNFLYV